MNTTDDFTRNTEFYYEDGNICLAAGSTVFRVLKSQLARHSSLFQDMFAIPSPTDVVDDGQERYDGAPLVRVDDSPEDLEALFAFLWSPPLNPVTFEGLCSITRMSTKYLMDDIREWCTRQLEDIVPSTTDNENPLKTLTHYKTNPTHAATVIKVSRRCNLPQFLPLAYYATSCSSAQILSSNDPQPLDYEDLVKIIVAKERINALWDAYADNCRGPRCVACPKVWNLNQEKAKKMLARARDPLRFLLKKDPSPGRCPACNEARLTTRQVMAAEILSKLPVVFGLVEDVQQPEFDLEAGPQF